MHSCRNFTVLPADSERRWNPAQQMKTQLPTTKPKQNLPDRSSNRHVLLGMKKTSSLNMEKDTGKLWELTKLLNGEIPEKAQTVLKSEGEYIVQKEAASCLAKLYQEESNVKLPRERTCQVREQLAQMQNQPTSHNCMSQPITMKEIEAPIRQLKCKKAPGPDGVTNDMIKHLGPAAKKTLLELFNE